MIARRSKQGRMIGPFTILLVLILFLPVLFAGTTSSKKPALRVLIIPKFEIGEMSGDFPGEALL